MKKTKSVLERREIDIMIGRAGNLRDKALLAFLYLTGARISEVVRSVRKGDFRYEEPFLLVKLKTLKNPRQPFRILGLSVNDPYTRIVMQYLREVKENDHLWPYSRQYVWKLLKKLGGRDVHPHVFRHTRLTHCVLIGDMNEFDLARFAGWSSPTPAMTYVHMKYRDILPKIERMAEKSRE